VNRLKKTTKILGQASWSLVKDLTRELPTIKQNRDVMSCLIDKVELLEKVPIIATAAHEANRTAVKLETSIEKLNVLSF
jgi:hypothetical protein